MLASPLLLTLGAALSGPFTSPGSESFEREVVSSNALWVAHVDVRRLVGSTLFETLSQHAGYSWTGKSLSTWINTDGKHSGKEGESLIEKYGFNPMTDLLDITIYGTSESEDSAVLLLRTTDRVEATLTKLHKDFPEFGFTDAGGRHFHALEEDGHDVLLYVHEPKVAGSGSRRAVSSERTLVLGSNEQFLLDAIAVLEGTGSGLSASPHQVLRNAPQSGAIIWMAAVQDPERWSWDLDSALAAKAENARFALGERDEKLFLDLAVGTRTAEDAYDMVSTLQGLQAMARLMAPEGVSKKSLGEVLRGLSVRHEGARVELAFEMSVDRILEIVGELSGRDEWSTPPPEPVEKLEPVEKPVKGRKVFFHDPAVDVPVFHVTGAR